jgi:protein gp37
MTTNIEWVRNPNNEAQGITANGKTGCLNQDKGLCRGGGFPCYAYKLANTRLKERYQANTNIAPVYSEEGKPYHKADKDIARIAPFYPRFWPERLEQIRKIKKPTGIFLDDMSDWMGDYWPEEWTQQELDVMRDCPQHRFYTLTKQPQNLIKFSPFPENCWVGVTATSRSLVHHTLPYLMQLGVKIKYLSLEPLLNWDDHSTKLTAAHLLDANISLLIIGACTGTYEEMHRRNGYTPATQLMRLDDMGRYTLQPRIEWVQETMRAADKASIKVFLKDNLKPLIKKFNEKICSECEVGDPCFACGSVMSFRQELP